MTTYWLGVDVGTGGSRAILLDSGGREAAAVSVAHQDIVMEQPLWAQQRPENWADAAFEAIRGALAAAGITGDQVRGIGLSGQMHGLVILDQQHQVIRPALIWCDQRSQPQVDWINQRLGAVKVLEYTANPVLTGFTLPKLLWVRDNEPRRFRECAASSAAQGLCSLSPHWRTCHRGFRRVGNRNVRRRSPPVVLRNDGWLGPGPFHSSARVRVRRCHWNDL